jgi:uncharacterized protein (TIGR02598 family)
MKTKHKAFSLIEVVIALGIFAFCIVGIVGLLPIASNAVKSVSQESNANNIAESIAGMWQVVSFTNSTNYSTNITNANFPVTNLMIRSTPLNTNYYFNDFGQETNSNSAALKMEYDARTNDTYSNAYDINLTFYWPANAPTNSPTVNKRTFNYIFAK